MPILEERVDHKGTRQAVLVAARSVFSRHPYNAASLRMIAKEAGFGHAIIGYYFPTKAELFRAVADDIYSGLSAAHDLWIAEVRHMSLKEGFERYVKRFVDFSRENPWVLRIMMLNIAGERVGAIPGQDILIEAIEGMRRTFVTTMKLTASVEEIGRFSDSFNALMIYYLGATESAAWLIRMDMDSPEYYEWVQKTLVTVFLPTLGKLFERR
jgi:TetR/AcrR family transcriptional regulator